MSFKDNQGNLGAIMKKNLFIIMFALFSVSAFAEFESLNCVGELEGSNIVKKAQMSLSDSKDEFKGFRAEKAVGGIYFKAKKADNKIVLEIAGDKEIIISEQFKSDDDLVLSTLVDKNISASIYCYETVSLEAI
jgi:hypothetical protein